MPWQAARLRLASLILAVLVAAGGAGAYLHGQSPTPVDAQTVLHRAEAASPGPNEAVHETYRVSASGGLSGTTEAWVGADATGSPTEFALTQTMFEDGHPAPGMSSRLVQTDQTFQVYDPASNTVTESSSGRPVGVMSSSPSTPVQDLEGMFVGTLVAQKLSRALESGTHPIPFQLERKTLDGVSVYALTLPDAGGQTFYFNTQSYVLEGADWVQAGRSWQARLDPASYQTMALAAVPPHTFTLNAPATARVVTLAPAAVGPKGAGHDDIITAMATACNTTAEALTAALQAGDKSMLAVCQETAPDMTVDRLVTALTAAFKSELDAQVASGAITPAQEASDLASLRAKLTRMVTGQPGTGAKGKQP
jgi:hypothetical protein